MNNADSFVRILFHGLFIIAENRDPRSRRWEVGLPPNMAGHAVHFFTMLLRRIDGDGSTTTEILDDLPRDIAIQPDPPSPPSYHRVGDIDRVNDTGDVEHFRWIIDMESGDFHGGRLNKRRGNNPGGPDYANRLFIGGGVLYTYARTVERYVRHRVPAGPNPDARFIGRFAHDVAIEIRRDAATSVTIDAGASRRLEQQAGVRYELVCRHLPQPGALGGNSHFPHYYHVLEDRGGDRRFDVIHADAGRGPLPRGGHDIGGHDHAGGRADDDQEFRRSVEPQVCNPVFLGQEEGGLPENP